MEIGTGMPGYHSLMPKTNGSIAEILKQNGYNTIWYGKNHNVPDWHSSQARSILRDQPRTQLEPLLRTN